MATEQELPANPLSYPQGGTFGELLDWHLRWGTRPGRSTTRKNARWPFTDFAALIHIGLPATASAENPDKKLRNWRKGAHLPDSDVVVENILQELFGNDPGLQQWKRDLEGALEWERRKKLTALSSLRLLDSAKRGRRYNPNMAQDASCVIEATKYPTNGTYRELLEWHLNVWGTHFLGDSSPSEPWILDTFAALVHVLYFDRSIAMDNVRDWLEGYSLPPSNIAHRIERELFGDNPIFEQWRDDLRRALSTARMSSG